MSNHQSLLDTYDGLKSEINTKPMNTDIRVGNVGNLPISPGAQQWRTMASKEADRLSNHAANQVMLKIYCQLVPMDADYIQGNMGAMKQDVDDFLSAKGQTAMQYLTSCKEGTKAPLLEYLVRSCQGVGRSFMEKANEILKDAQEKDLALPPPVADEESEEVEGQIVEIEKDNEYDEFITKMRDKTIKKIIDDVSEIIVSKKKDKDMSFDLKEAARPSWQPKDEQVTESMVGVAIDYLHRRLVKENAELTAAQEEAMMGLAIREAVLNEIDRNFGSTEATFPRFESRVRFGKGYLITESAVGVIFENTDLAKKEPLLKEEKNGKQADVANRVMRDRSGRETPMTDAEAKENLSPDEYEDFKKNKTSK